MYRIKIITIGKIKEKWLAMALGEYEKRLSDDLFFEYVLAKDNEQLIKLCLKEKFFISLDKQGKELSSEKFAFILFDLFEKNKLALTFTIGGAEGLPEEIVKQASFSISLSPMTFTHQIIRLILVEQIYRSFEIAKGSKYHK